jgi:hypothetical protein
VNRTSTVQDAAGASDVPQVVPTSENACVEIVTPSDVAVVPPSLEIVNVADGVNVPEPAEPKSWLVGETTRFALGPSGEPSLAAASAGSFALPPQPAATKHAHAAHRIDIVNTAGPSCSRSAIPDR